MKRDLLQFTRQRYDVLVVGGGINGAAVAHLAVLNGLKTALLEKGDFAGGTSGKSTKLIHGGLRYLENFEFGLVRESLRERHVQLHSAPHLVHPLRFVIPVYKTDTRPFWMMKLGVWLYDFLSGKYVLEKHRALTAEEVCRLIPGIRREGLIGGVAYSDAQMDDARLCLENVLSAVEKGAHAANYAEVRSLIQENGKSVGVKVYDHLTDKTFEVRAKKIVSAVGPWANIFMRKESGRGHSRPTLRTTKGIHVVYKGQLAQDALLIPTRNDQRVFFVIPWMGNSLIGTTDTDYTGSPDDVGINSEDIGYLIQETKRVLPHAELTESNIVTSFAGLRPLVHDQGAPAKLSRRHVIKESYSGIIYILGGKYTTYRKIAEDVVKLLTRKTLVDTREYFPVYGSGEIQDNPDEAGKRYGLPADTVQYLMDFYGIRFKDVLRLTDGRPELKAPLCACSPALRAQVVYAVETEMARTEEDIILRRLGLDYIYCPTGSCRGVIHQMALDLSWKPRG